MQMRKPDEQFLGRLLTWLVLGGGTLLFGLAAWWLSAL
jgi:hypothetical protein